MRSAGSRGVLAAATFGQSALIRAWAKRRVWRLVTLVDCPPRESPNTAQRIPEARPNPNDPTAKLPRSAARRHRRCRAVGDGDAGEPRTRTHPAAVVSAA